MLSVERVTCLRLSLLSLQRVMLRTASLKATSSLTMGRRESTMVLWAPARSPAGIKNEITVVNPEYDPLTSLEVSGLQSPKAWVQRLLVHLYPPPGMPSGVCSHTSQD